MDNQKQTLINNDIETVNQVMTGGGVWSHKREAWYRLKAVLGELDKNKDIQFLKEMHTRLEKWTEKDVVLKMIEDWIDELGEDN